MSDDYKQKGGKCRDCNLYDLESVKSKNGSVLSNRAAKCLWVSSEVWPLSAKTSFNSRPKASYMEPNDGRGCKQFIPRSGEMK